MITAVEKDGEGEGRVGGVIAIPFFPPAGRPVLRTICTGATKGPLFSTTG